jgi:hypothetical protein
VPGLNDSELTISLVDVQGLGKEGPASMRCQATCKNVSLDMTGSLTMPRSGLSLLMEDVQARVTLPNPLQATPPITTEVTGTFFLDPRNHRMVVRAMRATMPGLDMLTSSTLNWTRSSWEGGIIVNANTPQCIPALGLPAPLVSSLPRDLDLRTHFSLHPDTLVLRDVHAVMDGQSFHGQTKISDFSRPNITFKIFGDHVDLSRYLFSAPNSPSTPPQWLKTARIRGSFSANRMTWGSMVAENPQTLVRARKGILRIYPFKATMDKGTVEANMRVNLNVSPPTSTLRAQVKNIQINNVTDTGQPSTGLIGSMSMFLDLTWDDLPWRPRCATLRGQATLDAVNGTLIGVRLPRLHPSSLLTQRTTSPGDVIPFSRLDARLEIHKGIMKTRRLNLTSPSLTLKARGTYDLCKDRLDGLLFLDSPPSRQTLHVQGSRNNPRLRMGLPEP